MNLALRAGWNYSYLFPMRKSRLWKKLWKKLAAGLHMRSGKCETKNKKRRKAIG